MQATITAPAAYSVIERPCGHRIHFYSRDQVAIAAYLAGLGPDGCPTCSLGGDCGGFDYTRHGHAAALTGN